ncbi:MAG: hypothetical protein ABIG11_05220, partial [bacterium]
MARLFKNFSFLSALGFTAAAVYLFSFSGPGRKDRQAGRRDNLASAIFSPGRRSLRNRLSDNVARLDELRDKIKSIVDSPRRSGSFTLEDCRLLGDITEETGKLLADMADNKFPENFRSQVAAAEESRRRHVEELLRMKSFLAVKNVRKKGVSYRIERLEETTRILVTHLRGLTVNL